MARAARAAAPPPPPRALGRYMTGAAAPAGAAAEVALEARPALDFLISLVHDTEPELLPRDAAWHEGAMASLSDTLRRDFDRAFGHSDEEKGLGWALIPLIVPDTAVQRSADVVAAASRLDVRDLCREACTDDPDLTELRALMERHFAGEPGLEAEMLTAAPPALRGAIARVVKDPEGEMRSLRRILRAWQERFAEIEERVLRMQERDVAQRRPELATMPLVDFIEKATDGYRWVPDGRVRTIRFSPSYFARPYNYIFGEGPWHLICYPLAESALDGDPGGVPSATLRLFRALGDESRMRILRHLADGDLYLTEIAERMDLSKPTVKHHLAQLRAAGLVTVSETGGLTYYSLRRERLDDPGLELARYLGGIAR